MRVIFMGTPDFSVPVLDALVEAGHEVVLAVTQPDKPKGRGNQMQMSPVKERALELGIEVFQPVKIRKPEAVEVLREKKPELIVVVAFGQILPEDILNMPKYGCLNVHASLLPMYRGASPIQAVVLAGEKKTGVTIMKMDKGLDTGDILSVRELELAEDETGGSLFDRLSVLGGPLLIETVEKLVRGEITPVKQEGETCYAGIISKEQGKIDWTEDAAAIERRVRAMNPWPSAYTHMNGKTLKIWAAEVIDRDSELAPGTICESDKKHFCVQTGKGMLSVRVLQLEGKKRMEVDAFLRGCSVNAGDILS